MGFGKNTLGVVTVLMITVCTTDAWTIGLQGRHGVNERRFLSDDTACIEIGGQCQDHSASCSGSYVRGQCAGSITRLCCIGDDTACTEIGGQCQEDSVSCNGSYVGGKCAGNIARRCCTESPAENVDTAGCHNVTVVTRQEWRARTAIEIEYLTTPIGFVFIHHTAMSPCQTLDGCSRNVRTIQNLHMDDRGWSDLGYNFLVGEDGRVYESRGWDRQGAHTSGWNNLSIAISVMGNYMTRLPSEAARHAVDDIIDCGVQTGKLKSDYLLYGHRDVRDTECPGDELYSLIRNSNHFGTLPPVRP